MSTTHPTPTLPTHPLHAAAADAYNARDLPTWAGLYEEQAVLLSTRDGALLRGQPAIRPALAAFFELHGKIRAETLYALEADGIMLLRGRFTLDYKDEGKPQTMVAETVEVARRGADGTWRVLIDHPGGGAPVPVAPAAAR